MQNGEVSVVLIVFITLLLICLINNYFAYKRRKLEVELRREEMRKGIAPGTYSRLKNKDLKKMFRSEEEKVQSTNEREELIEGIASLKSRIENIDTIMAQRKKDKENKND